MPDRPTATITNRYDRGYTVEDASAARVVYESGINLRVPVPRPSAPVLGPMFTVVAVGNAILLTAFQQWEACASGRVLQ